ncbi:MAG: formyltransferase family protein [Chloroflexi bacterium]|nr:formyltransferase family protein [Chloroflexota bacterium]
MLSIGWFSTGRGEGSRGLLNFVHKRLIGTKADARIDFVFSNRERGEAEGSDEFFRLVHGYGIPLVTHSSSAFRKIVGGPISAHRDEFDQQVMDKLAGREVDICVLAGYMLIVGGKMCRQYPLLNLHPALPDGPTGTWQEVVWSLIQTRATETGAMVHLATEEVDRGPVISHVTVPLTGTGFDQQWDSLRDEDLEDIKKIQGEDFALFQSIRREQYLREPYLLFETLRAVSEGEVAIREGQVFDDSGAPLSASMPNGLCLNHRVAEAMSEDLKGNPGNAR